MAFQKSADPKTELIKFRVTPTEKAAIEVEAAARHLTVSEFALRRMLSKQAPVRFDRDAIDTLAKLVQELRVAYRSGVAGTAGEEVIARWKDLAVEAIYSLGRK